MTWYILILATWRQFPRQFWSIPSSSVTWINLKQPAGSSTQISRHLWNSHNIGPPYLLWYVSEWPSVWIYTPRAPLLTNTQIERLLVFQDMCLLSTESGTHKLDGWMLRFLIEHSLDIEAKKMQVNPSSLNADSEKLSSKAKELTEQGRYLRFRSP